MKEVLIAMALFFAGGVVGTMLHQQSKTTKKDVIEKDKDVVTPTLSVPTEPDVTTKKKKITHLELNDSQIVTLFDEVSSESALRVVNELKEKSQYNDIVYLLLDSPGGSVLAGAQIISAVEGNSVPVYTVCVGICASMAAMIFEYGNKRLSLDRSILMFHPAAGGVQGNLNEMKSLLAFIDRYTKKMDAYVVLRAKSDAQTWDNMVAHNVWLDGEDAVDKGFADKMVSLGVKLSIDTGLSNYRKNSKFPLFLFDMK